MYDELVKRLWECASGECFNCSQYTPTTNASVCQKELMKQAADATEELSAAVEGYESSTNMVLVEKDGETVIEFQPKWIPVTERLPEERKDVLVALRRGEIAVDYYQPNRWGYSDVTHWMPLPQPPKEEKIS